MIKAAVCCQYIGILNTEVGILQFFINQQIKCLFFLLNGKTGISFYMDTNRYNAIFLVF